MNFIEYYLQKPGNYILEAGGGWGKSTSLRCLARELAGTSQNGKKVLPVYIPMGDLNLEMIQPGVLFQYLRKYFSYQVTREVLINMIGESCDTTEYVFLLDGINEVHNYEVYGQTVLHLIWNDVVALLEFSNVHVVLSTRRADLLNGNYMDYFQVLMLSPLSNNVLREYLELQDLEMIPGHLRQMLKNPMLLTVFKKVYDLLPAQACKVENKYELLELYFRQDQKIHARENYTDHLLEVRSYILDKILPYLAFHEELDLMKKQREDVKKLSVLLKRAYRMYTAPEYTSLDLIWEVTESMGILDENLHFTHELFRDFFAVKGWQQMGAKGETRKILDFLENLVDWMEYRNDRKELPRRTRFLDLGDFLYSAVKKELMGVLTSYGVDNQEKIICLSQNFYQHLSGIYEDLQDGEEAAEIGWIALDHLQKAEKYYPVVTAADKYSFTYYSVKWDKERYEETLEVIQYARKLLDQVENRKRNQDYHTLYGKVLSNIGSYYYKLGTDEERNKKESYEALEEARKWHQKALEYRKEYGPSSKLAISYKTLMSDAYQMGQYLTAYAYYREAMEALGQGKDLREQMILGKAAVPEELVERAMGSELKLLEGDGEAVLQNEILQELLWQIPYVYERCTDMKRKNLEMLKSLEEKLERLEASFRIRGKKELQETVTEYLRKCKSFH